MRKRIASALRRRANRFDPPQPVVIHPTFTLDGRVLAESVARYSLSRAARGPSSLVGGSLVTGIAPRRRRICRFAGFALYHEPR